jgi:5-methylcytosine-specific restriction endonuclease McrA
VKRVCTKCSPRILIEACDYAAHEAAHRRAAGKVERRTPPGWKKLRLAIIERDRGACVVCGSSAFLEVHHVNGDWRDNRTSNLETRCRKHNPRGPETTEDGGRW